MKNRQNSENRKTASGKLDYKKLIIRIVVGVVLAAAFGALIFYANHDGPRYTSTKNTGIEYETAKVIAVIKDNSTVDSTMENVLRGSTELQIKILTGRYKGDECFITNYYSTLYNVIVREGDTISVRIDTTGEGVYSASVYNYNRIPLCVGLVVLFAVVLILIGGKQGLKSFVGLVFTVVSIFFILLPLTLKGFSPIPLTCVIIFVTTSFCFYLIGGVQKKTVSAALGSLGGVLIAALLGQVASAIGGITTFQMEEAEALVLVKSTFPLKLRGLFTSGILIASMGAVMDIAMSIASALDEVHRLNPNRGFKELFGSGMRIGRDAMGTMSNTLVLAYVGSALNMMVLIYSYGVTFTQLINTDFVAIELIRAVAGSIGIIFTVPCVSAIAAGLFTMKKK